MDSRVLMLSSAIIRLHYSNGVPERKKLLYFIKHLYFPILDSCFLYLSFLLLNFDFSSKLGLDGTKQNSGN